MYVCIYIYIISFTYFPTTAPTKGQRPLAATPSYQAAKAAPTVAAQRLRWVSLAKEWAMDSGSINQLRNLDGDGR